MLGGIKITPSGDTTAYLSSAQRISALLEIALHESEWIRQCEGELTVSQFLESTDRVIVIGIFFGKANGQEFSMPFERDYLVSDNPSSAEWLKSPIFVFLLTAFRALYNEQDPEKNAANWRERSEFEIAAKLEAKIYKLVGAPVEGIRSVWRYSMVSGISAFLLATTCTAVYAFTHPHPRSFDESTFERLVVSILGGALFAGVPAGLAGVFIGLSFIGRDVEESVAGQSLLRLVGVKDSRALRIVSIAGAICCLLGAAYFFSLLFFRR